MRPVLEVQSLVKRYRRHLAVDHLDLTVQSGQVVGFLGPNGAGKTTTIRSVLGLIRPTGGTIRIDGRPHADPRARARLGALVESPTAYGHLSGRDNLEIVRRLRGAPHADVDRALDTVGLIAAARRLAREYSLGMRGRLSIAAALIGSPDLLILDEPTNGLDPQGIREVRDLIRGLPERGITVLISSHLLAEVEQTATHVAIVRSGRRIFQGSLEELHARAQTDLHVRVDRPEDAARLLAPDFPDLRVDPDGLRLPHTASAPDVNIRLVNAGLRVSHLATHRRSLEDLFLDLTAPAGGQA